MRQLLKYGSVFLLFLCACVEKIDFEYLDTLMQEKEFQAVLDYAREIKRGAIADSVVRKKLEHRVLMARKGLLFKGLYELSLKDSIKQSEKLNYIFNEISELNSLKARWFWFDYFLANAEFKREQGHKNQWISNSIKAVEYPTNRVHEKISLLQQLAFYYASQNHFEEAREWMDKALRSMDLRENKQFEEIYIEYMNGNFEDASRIASSSSMKTEGSMEWQQFIKFLNLYADSLTIENRFRLW